MVLFAGCTQQNRGVLPAPSQSRVIVVAPVLNLSGSADLDPLKVTDIVASEFQSQPNVAVIPVNRVLAALAMQGRATIDGPDDAVELARHFGADATVIVAITEYDPYDPPRVGMVMQWYAVERTPAITELDPVSASRSATEDLPRLSAWEAAIPRWQVQRVFNAADEEMVKSLKEYAEHRDGYKSPYGWRRYVQSQELFLRCCSWALIRPIIQLDENGSRAVESREAAS